MGNLRSAIGNACKKIFALIDELKKETEDAAITVEIVNAFKTCDRYISEYGKSYSNAEIEIILLGRKTHNFAQNAAILCDLLLNARYLPINVNGICMNLRSRCFNLMKFIERSLKDSVDKKELFDTNSSSLIVSKAYLLEQKIQIERILKKITEAEVRIDKVGIEAKDFEKTLDSELKKAIALFDAAQKDIESKKGQIDKILGHVSGRTIAGDFEKSAVEERSMADYLRYASLGCMTLIVSIVAYSFWETTTDKFNWESSIFRIILAFMLSIPAAYLAKESSKHRDQQYSHLQTSLDLKTISPYIASLPEEEQHKIKIEVASRLFSPKKNLQTNSDSYPINVHEIVMEILKKLDFKKDESKK
jgi:hypothetical protein